MISIITPVLNEEENISSFINHIKSLSGDFELILVDGGSTDSTINEIDKCRKIFQKKLTLVNSQKGRGYQMNRGAEIARGNIFLFLHVDCKLEKDTINFIEKELKENEIIGGGMYQKFIDSDSFLDLASNFGNFRSKSSQIFFGDCGIFIQSDIFKKIGGYDEVVYLEDVEFCKKAKRFGKLKLIDRQILTSPRRYLKTGRIKITLIFTLTYFLNSLGLRPDFLIKYIVDK
jgi:rSAM/selenodomain-associated transferase 2